MATCRAMQNVAPATSGNIMAQGLRVGRGWPLLSKRWSEGVPLRRQVVLGNGIAAVLTSARRVESQHNVFLGDAMSDKLFGNTVVCAVELDPHFAITNIDVQHRPMNPVDTVPAGIDEFIMVVALIEDDFRLHISDRGLYCA